MCPIEIKAIACMLNIEVKCDIQNTIKITDATRLDKGLLKNFTMDEKYHCSHPTTLEGWVKTLAEDLKHDKLRRMF